MYGTANESAIETGCPAIIHSKGSSLTVNKQLTEKLIPMDPGKESCDGFWEGNFGKPLKNCRMVSIVLCGDFEHKEVVKEAASL